MPINFKVDVSNRIVLSRATGRLTYSDASEHIEALSALPAFQRDFNQWLDLRDATFELTAAEIQQLAERNVFSRTSKRAMLVSSPMQYGLIRMFGLYREAAGETGIRAFRTPAEACAWLQLAAEPTLAIVAAHSRGEISPTA